MSSTDSNVDAFQINHFVYFFKFFSIVLDSEQKFLLQVSSNNQNHFSNMRTLVGESSLKTLEVHHTHFLLSDNGRLDYYIDDTPRDKFVQATCDRKTCYPVTIIVEGGGNTPEVILNDLRNNRPVVIVAGSGRLSNVLGEILSNANDSTIIG